jgi:hypothetical protein
MAVDGQVWSGPRAVLFDAASLVFVSCRSSASAAVVVLLVGVSGRAAPSDLVLQSVVFIDHLRMFPLLYVVLAASIISYITRWSSRVESTNLRRLPPDARNPYGLCSANLVAMVVQLMRQTSFRSATANERGVQTDRK